MKKLVLLFLTISLLGFNSCEKNISEAPGKIPGMGDAPGELQIKERFVLPDGINVVGEIAGPENPVGKDELKPLLAYDSKTVVPRYGSGCVVRLKLTCVNSRNYPRTVFFPQGLIFKCITKDYQDGLCCQTFWVTLAPNERRTFEIELYCTKKGIPAPDSDGKFTIWGVTDSNLLWGLLNKVGWKKINFNWIYRDYLNTKGTMAEGPTYEEITQRLQVMVHNLTNNGIEISAEDEAFLSTIPELALEERPVLDENSKFPEYFEEFLVPGK